MENLKNKISKKNRDVKGLNAKISEIEEQKSLASQELTSLSHETVNYRPFIEKELTSLMKIDIKIVGAITKLVK